MQESVVRESGGKVSQAVDTAARHHHACFVCGRHTDDRLGLKFHRLADGDVTTQFACESRFQGYPDRIHGGVIAMLLDDAMVNCLLHEGVVGVTGRLNVSFRAPVRLERMAEIRAHIVSRTKSLYTIKAELYQGGCLMTQAEGKFMGESGAISPPG